MASLEVVTCFFILGTETIWVDISLISYLQSSV